jgi:hypothetical protein
MLNDGIAHDLVHAPAQMWPGHMNVTGGAKRPPPNDPFAGQPAATLAAWIALQRFSISSADLPVRMVTVNNGGIEPPG